MIPQTPRGFRDVLPQEAAWREDIREAVQDCFASWGYMPIETPALEVQDVMTAGGGDAGHFLSLFDIDGKLLTLRPDVTLPIARMVASRLGDDQGPFRFRYCEQVFREEASLRAQSRVNTQLGIESIGLSGSGADAEVIALFMDALEACGLEEYTVAIASVEVLRSLIAAAGMDQSWNAKLLQAYHSSNLVELGELVHLSDIDPAYASALLKLPRIRGGKEAIESCSQLLAKLPGRKGAQDPCASLLATWKILDATGYSKHLVVDWGVMSSFDYYTGLVMEAYAPALGASLGSGGRYDQMLEAYGRDLPAAGFAFSLERVMQALVEQDKRVQMRRVHRIDASGDTIAMFREAKRLRGEGLRVALDYAAPKGGKGGRDGR